MQFKESSLSLRTFGILYKTHMENALQYDSSSRALRVQCANPPLIYIHIHTYIFAHRCTYIYTHIPKGVFSFTYEETIEKSVPEALHSSPAGFAFFSLTRFSLYPERIQTTYLSLRAIINITGIVESKRSNRVPRMYFRSTGTKPRSELLNSGKI